MTARATYEWIGPNRYTGIYMPWGCSKPRSVTDEHGKVITFRTPEQAECAAWRALYAEEDRIEAMRFDPAQVRETPRQWAAFRPKSFAGKRAAAESIFRERNQA